jgi:hypothetical protein
MRTIKLIAGIGCFVLALYFWFLKLGGFSLWFAICGVGFIEVGCFLLIKRKSGISRNGKAIIALTLCFIGVFMGVIGIPDFVAATYENSRNACINDLRQLQAAKEEWALENGKTNGTLVTESDITPYIQLDSKGQVPKCTVGGTYIIGRVGEDVRCSVGTSDWPNRYILSDPNDFTWWENFKGAYGILFGFRHVPKP